MVWEWELIDWLNVFKRSKPEVTEEIQEKPKKGPHIVWLHGANQTSNSFNYIKKIIPDFDCTLVNYSSQNGFFENLDIIVSELDKEKPTFVIGHSMGGLYALHLINHINVVGGISISTPFRGSTSADWAKFVCPSYQLFRDVGKRSKPIQQAHKIEIKVPWTQIITTEGGVPYLGSANDGVCTIEEMEHRKEMEFVYVPYTHYEVVCVDEVAEIIHEKYKVIIEKV